MVAAMNWTSPRPKIEIAAEWISTGLIALAVAFALAMLAPGGAIAAPLGAIGAAVAAVLAQRGVRATPGAAEPSFVPVDFPVCDDGEDAVLLLDCPSGEDEEENVLLLDMPLPPAGEESRVVRLFGNAGPQPTTAIIPAPGEMLARIEDFLGANRTAPPAAGPVPAANAASADASAALHAALADIRRSLRQG